MAAGLTRRRFLSRTAAATASVWVAGAIRPVRAWGANDKLNIAAIGAGGRAASNLRGVASENIVALCDVDTERLAKASELYPLAMCYADLRRVLERDDLDAVVVSTPDHMHAYAAVHALRLGKHVYCEKPLTHSVWEARLLRNEAAKRKVATQMGNQGHASASTRRIVELLQAGVIGQVRELHAWTNRPIWPQGLVRPATSPDAPHTVHWELWIGVAPDRPYDPTYHPFKWRGWWDFGTGALGDMACHVLDAANWALKLGAPTRITAEAPESKPETAPNWCILRYDFPQRGELAPLKMTWYDGGKLPPTELFEGERVNNNGTLYIGDKGKLYVPSEYSGNHLLLPRDRFKDFQAPAPSIPDSPGHHEEWIQACKTGKTGGSNFDYAAGLTETVLLGNLALRSGGAIDWNSAELKVTNTSAADPFIKRIYRPGWEL